MLKYVKDNKVLMVIDEFGNKEILDKDLMKSFDETVKVKSDKDNEEEPIEDEGA